jgi:D-glycero-alpha-D-manno-heptose-7-phosphate kinase
MVAMVDEAQAILTAERPKLDDIGRLLHEGWTLKRSLSDGVTTDAIDAIYEAGLSAGAVGGKLLGAGGGGFMLLFAEPARHNAIRKALGEFLDIPFQFENKGTHILFHEESKPFRRA